MPVTIDQLIIDRNIKTCEKDFNYKLRVYNLLIQFNDKLNKRAGVRLTNVDTGHYLEFSRKGLTNLSPTVSANKITFTVGDAVIEYIIDTTYIGEEKYTRIKENITLNSKPPVNTVEFDLTINGLTRISKADGEYFYDGGIEFLYFPLPTIKDATGKNGIISWNWIDISCSLTIEQGFLDTATYPITLDPSTVWTDTGKSSTVWTDTPKSKKGFQYKVFQKNTFQISSGWKETEKSETEWK